MTKTEFKKQMIANIEWEEIKVWKLKEVTKEMGVKENGIEWDENALYVRKFFIEGMHEPYTFEIIWKEIVYHFVKNEELAKKVIKLKGSKDVWYKWKDIFLVLNGVNIQLSSMPQKTLNNIEHLVKSNQYKSLESGILINLYNHIATNSPLVFWEIAMLLILNGKTESWLRTHFINIEKKALKNNDKDVNLEDEKLKKEIEETANRLFMEKLEENFRKLISTKEINND